MFVVIKFDSVPHIVRHIDELTEKFFVYLLIYPACADSHRYVRRLDRRGLYFFQRGNVLVVVDKVGKVLFVTLRRLQLIRHSARKVFFRRFKARIFIFGIDRNGVSEHGVAEFGKHGIVILFREFFDIRNIYCAALVLTDLQCFKAVVRACYRRVRADRALEKYIRFRDRFFIFGYVLAGKQQCAVAVGFEKPRVCLAVDVAETLYESVVLCVQFPLFALQDFIGTALHLNIQNVAQLFAQVYHIGDTLICVFRERRQRLLHHAVPDANIHLAVHRFQVHRLDVVIYLDFFFCVRFFRVFGIDIKVFRQSAYRFAYCFR